MTSATRDAELNLQIAPSSGGCTCWPTWTSPWLLSLSLTHTGSQYTQFYAHTHAQGSKATIGACASSSIYCAPSSVCVWASPLTMGRDAGRERTRERGSRHDAHYHHRHQSSSRREAGRLARLPCMWVCSCTRVCVCVCVCECY